MQVRAWENQEEEWNVSLFNVVSRIGDNSGIKPLPKDTSIPFFQASMNSSLSIISHWAWNTPQLQCANRASDGFFPSSTKLWRNHWKHLVTVVSMVSPILTKRMKADAHFFKIRHMAAEVCTQFTLLIVGITPKEHVKRPKFCLTERCQMRKVRPKHQRHNCSWGVTTRHQERIQKIAMHL